MTGPPRLQSRPAVQVAIGSLPAGEQSHVRIALRVVGPRLPLPCVAIEQVHGDIVLAPAQDDADSIRVTCAHGQRLIDRPVRLVPLADALSELIEEILAREDGAPTSADAGDDAPAAAPATGDGEEIAAVLLDRARGAPLALHGADGLELLVDARYHTAWVSLDGTALAAALTQPVRVQSIAAGSLAGRIADGGPLRPVAVEQLAWLAPAGATTVSALERWLADPGARLRLLTWPNLSLQPDHPQWLELLARLSRQGMRVSEVIAAGQRAGIEPARLRKGLALLCVFRHATLERGEPSDLTTHAPAQPTATRAAARQAAGSGLLGRLRSRFRALMGSEGNQK